jgi:hypothetical protein
LQSAESAEYLSFFCQFHCGDCFLFSHCLDG